MRFKHPSGQDSPPPKPPPNYFSRGVQLRLLLMVSALMLVLVLMDQVRDPELIRNFFRAAGAPLPEAPEAEREPRAEDFPHEAPPPVPMDSRLRPVYLRGMGSDDLPADAEEALDRAVGDAWQQALQQVAEPHYDALRLAMDRTLFGPSVPEAEAEDVRAAADQLDAAWERYFTRARQTVEQPAAGLTEAQQEAWHRVLEQLQQYWRQRARPVLEKLAGSEPLDSWDPEARQWLQAIRFRLLDLALGQVRDNQVFRPQEKDAWFSLFHLLQHTRPTTLEQHTVDRVGYLELSEQAGAYRGRLVTVRGEVRKANYVLAPQNIYGIEGYYIFWLKPADGTNAPLVVYSLEAPPGFPDVAGPGDRERTELAEPVEVTGYGFKNLAYQAQRGISHAPLVLARSPEWHPVAAVARRDVPGPLVIAVTVALCGVLALAIASLVYWQGRRASSVALTKKGAARPDWDRVEPVTSPQEHLQQLSERAKNEGG